MAWPSKKKPKKKFFGREKFDLTPSQPMMELRSRVIKIAWNDAYAQIATLDRILPYHFQELQIQCAYMLDGAWFSTAYMRGKWDGREYLMDSHGQFYTGLLPMVHRWLVEKGYSVRLFKQKPVYDDMIQYDAPKIDIHWARPYQRDAVASFLNSKRGVIHMATGGGKTLVAAMCINEIRRPTIFMVHTRDLLHQAQDMLGDALKQKIGTVGDGVFDPRAVTVCMIQSVAAAYNFEFTTVDDDEPEYDDDDFADDFQYERRNRFKRFLESAGLLIMDEVHRVGAPTALGAMSAVKNAEYRLGLSASPWRDDGADMAIEAAFGPICHHVPASYLIKKGWLVPPLIRFHELPPLYEEEGERYSDFYARAVAENDTRNRKVVDLATMSARANRPCLILVRYIRHGVALERMFHKKRFDDVVFLSGNDEGSYRKQILNQMRHGELKVLIATTIADEGLDIPNLATIILAGSGKSSTKALQRVGRVLRPAPGKRMAEVHDFADTGRWLSDHVVCRRRIYETEEEFIIV